MAAASGIPVPTVHASGVWNGRPYMLLEWCYGQPMLNEILARPWALWSTCAAADRMQAKLHRVEAPPEVAGFRDWIAWGHSDEALAATLRAVATKGNALLHGDFHPLNVLVSGSRVTAVIDWTNACAGDPRADVARTVSTLLLAPVFGGWRRVLVAPLRRLKATAWLRGYVAEAGEPLRGMAPFYAWAGKVMLEEFAARGADLRPTERWVRKWRRLV